MSVLNCARLVWKYRRHWNKKLLSLSSSVPLKVSGMWALVPLVLVLGPGVWLELSVLASWPSISANCSLVFSLRQGFDRERVEKVGLLAVKLVLGLVVGASSQLGSLSTGTILEPGTGKTVQPGWIVLEGDLTDGVVLNVVAHLADKPSVHWNVRSCWRVFQVVGPELKNYSERKPFGFWSEMDLQMELLRSNSRLEVW